MNIEVRCYKCGEWAIVHAYSLRWIRCPVCHKRVWLDRASKRDALTKEPVTEEEIRVAVMVPKLQRGRREYLENW